MRLFLAFLACAFISACTTKTPDVAPSQAGTPHLTPVSPDPKIPLPSPITSPAPPRPEQEPEQTIIWSKLHHLTSNGISFHIFVCDDRKVRFSIADKENGPEFGWTNAQSAARAKKAIASINGGFFSPEGTPLGLVIESGKHFGNWNRSSSLTSGVFSVSDGKPRIVRTSNTSSGQTADYLLQTGPFLIENRTTVTGLSNSRSRPRSFLLWDGKHHWAFGYASNATLSALASALVRQPVPGMKIKTALNLDGGSSSQLWVAKSVKGGPSFHRPFLRKPVRNFILAHESQ